MKSKSLNLTPVFIAGVALLLVCAIHLAGRPSRSRGPQDTPGFDLFQRMELMTYDARARLATEFLTPSDTATNLSVLFLDNTAFDRIEEGGYGKLMAPFLGNTNLNPAELNYIWPWPRFLLGQVIRELSAQGAKGIFFDVIFTGRYPRADIWDVNVPGQGVVSSDEFMAMQMRKAGNVVLGTDSDLLTPELLTTNAYALGNVFAKTDYGVLRRVKAFVPSTNWHPAIQAMVKPLGLELRKARVFGNTNIFPQKPDPSAPDEKPGEFEVVLRKDGTLNLNDDGTLNLDETDAKTGKKDQKPYTIEPIWTLGIQMAARELGLDLSKSVIEPGRILLRGPGMERVIPVDDQGFFYIDWSLKFSDIKKERTSVYYGHFFPTLIQDAARFFRADASQLVAPFTNKIVLIGSVATGNNVADMGATPLSEKTVLVTKHLNIANALIKNRFITPSSESAELALILVLGILSSVVTWRTRVVSASVFVGLFAVVYVAAACSVYISNRYWLPIVMPLLGGLFLPHFSLLLYRVIFEQRTQRHIKAVFNKIVSPDVVNELLGKEKISFGGVRRPITVYFADVRGFTEFTESAQLAAEEHVKKYGLVGAEREAYFDSQAAETLDTVNMYLTAIADMVKKHKGTLDKYIGDCVMAFWGAPVPNEKHALSCVMAAIEAQRAMYNLNQARFAENERRKLENPARAAANQPLLPMLPLLSLGSGVNTGLAVVGLMGSDAHILNYTVFGSEVNLASRLEGVSARGRIVVSHSTYLEVKREDEALAATFIELAPTKVKGFREPVRIYEVPWKQPGESEATTFQTAPPPPKTPVI